MKNKREMSPKLNRTGWLFVLPSVILIIAFVFYPMAQAFITSFHTGAGNNLTFAGIANYKRLLTDTTFRKALFNTVLYLVVQVPIMILLALVISSMLNNKKRITDPLWAKILIIIAITWRWTGYNMVFYLSGLQGIDDSIYEAADIDGAGAFQKFKSITLPMLKPIILFTTINSTIGTLQLFDETMNITQGGPANGTITISQYIYNILFKYSPDFGYAAAVSYVIMIVVLSFIQMKVGDKND